MCVVCGNMFIIFVEVNWKLCWLIRMLVLCVSEVGWQDMQMMCLVVLCGRYFSILLVFVWGGLSNSLFYGWWVQLVLWWFLNRLVMWKCVLVRLLCVVFLVVCFIRLCLFFMFIILVMWCVIGRVKLFRLQNRLSMWLVGCGLSRFSVCVIIFVFMLVLICMKLSGWNFSFMFGMFLFVVMWKVRSDCFGYSRCMLFMLLGCRQMVKLCC